MKIRMQYRNYLLKPAITVIYKYGQQYDLWKEISVLPFDSKSMINKLIAKK